MVQEESSSRSSESTTVTWKYEQLHDVEGQSRLSLTYTTVAIYLLKVHLEFSGWKCAERCHFDWSHAIAEWEAASVYTLHMLNQTYGRV